MHIEKLYKDTWIENKHPRLDWRHIRSSRYFKYPFYSRVDIHFTPFTSRYLSKSQFKDMQKSYSSYCDSNNSNSPPKIFYFHTFFTNIIHLYIINSFLEVFSKCTTHSFYLDHIPSTLLHELFNSQSFTFKTLRSSSNCEK